MMLGERIKEQRSKHGFSQEKIAELVGISRQAVTKWESGQSVPSMANLMTLAEIFGVSLGDLTGGVNDSMLTEKMEKKKGTGKLISAIILTIIGIMTITIVSNMSAVTISRLAGVLIHEAHLVRLGVQLGSGMAISVGIVLFVLYIKSCKTSVK
ncbi:MAG: helix-turn-helix domain-containing protein [Oscillospiraceae bacterium]|nr:helix-turn-helix domain-containing protein [Oscillospiraceae bacterium]